MPDLKLLVLRLKKADEKAVWYSDKKGELATVLHSLDLDSHFVLGHNNVFDAAILSWHFGIKPRGLLDTLSMARAIYGPAVSVSLDSLAKLNNLGVKGSQISQAIGKRREDFSSSELADYGDYCINDVELTYALLKILISGFPKAELKLIDLTLRMFTEPVLQLDYPRLQQHSEEVKAEKLAAIEAVQAVIGGQDIAEVLRSQPKFAKALEALGVEVPTKISLRTGKPTFALAKGDEGFQNLLEHPDPKVQALLGGRLNAKSSIEETRTQSLMGIAQRGTLPIPLKYYGCSTGRWSASAEGINMQNLPRQSKIKEAIQASPGHVIVGADLSNIELRVGLWIAGQQDKLRLLSSGVDLYKDFIAVALRKSIDDVSSVERQIGKAACLALVYGTGADKLRKTLKTSGIQVSSEEAQHYVDAYRTTYDFVKRAWGSGGSALKTIESKGLASIWHNNIGVVDANGVKLPSGLYLQYPDLKFDHNAEGKPEWSYKGRLSRERLYGAKVFQGFTQAVARCIMAEHMLQISKEFKVVLTIHDAVYIVAKEAQAEGSLGRIIEIMKTAPNYMPGIVLDAEGSFNQQLSGI